MRRTRTRRPVDKQNIVRGLLYVDVKPRSQRQIEAAERAVDTLPAKLCDDIPVTSIRTLEEIAKYGYACLLKN